MAEPGPESQTLKGRWVTALADVPRPDQSQNALAQAEARSDALIDSLCRVLADAAGRGVVLAGGPLSKRKTDWLLCELMAELGQAERLVDALKQLASQGR